MHLHPLNHELMCFACQLIKLLHLHPDALNFCVNLSLVVLIKFFYLKLGVFSNFTVK